MLENATDSTGMAKRHASWHRNASTDSSAAQMRDAMGRLRDAAPPAAAAACMPSRTMLRSMQ